jgi:hypothetical protein
MGYNVQQTPGVPPLLGGFNPIASASLVTSDAANFMQASPGSKWGIFLNGATVIDADNVVSMDARQDAVLADFPLEGGTFESYDKVQRPFDVRFRVSVGAASKKSSVISTVKSIIKDYKLYMFVSPDDVFENVNCQHWDYHREAASVGLLVIDIWGWQIQVNTTSSTSNNTQSPAAADPSNGGSVNSVDDSSPSTDPSIKAHAAQMGSTVDNTWVTDPNNALP